MVNWRTSVHVFNKKVHKLARGSLIINNLSMAIQSYKSACIDLANLSQQGHSAHEDLKNEIHKYHSITTPSAKKTHHHSIVRLYEKIRSLNKLFKDRLRNVNEAKDEYEKYLKKFSDALK